MSQARAYGRSPREATAAEKLRNLVEEADQADREVVAGMGHDPGQRAPRGGAQPAQPEAEHEDLQRGEGNPVLGMDGGEEEGGGHQSEPGLEGASEDDLFRYSCDDG